MTENQKKEVAVFRFGVICEFVTGTNFDYGEKERIYSRSAPANGPSRILEGPGFPEVRFWDGSGSITVE